MGFFSKIWKSVKKGFKAVFKPIKKVFKTVGKFMNKIGIVGQIALMFIPIPGLGAFMSMLGKGATKLSGFLGTFSNVAAQGAKFVLDGAITVGTKVAQGFRTITEGVKTFVGNTSKFLANKIPGVNITSAPTSFFGPGSESVLGRTSANITKNFNALMAPIPTPTIASPTTNKTGGTALGPNAPTSEEILARANATGELPVFDTVGGSPAVANIPNVAGPLPVLESSISELGGSIAGGTGTGTATMGGGFTGGLTTPTVDSFIAPKQSLLSRAGDWIEGLPGKAGNFALQLPEKIAGKVITDTAYSAIMGKDTPQYEVLRDQYGIIDTNTSSTYAADSLSASMRQESPLENYANYMVPPMLAGTSAEGTWAMNLQSRQG
tara:strand:+ start:2403 stop:3539 length:1137 start_codon:yes stop_codon:yes gene_type:complete